MQSPWRLQRRQATLHLGPLQARVDLDHPAAGIGELTLSGRPISGARILGLVLPPGAENHNRFVEAYLRGNDLIATYAEPAQPALRWQIYWRAVSERFPNALAAVEAIVSVQTGLLDSQPELTLRSDLPTDRATSWRATADDRFESTAIQAPLARDVVAAEDGWACFSCDLREAGGAYVEMVHPDDFNASTLTLAGESTGTTLDHALFDQRLEKGVILRSRILSLFLAEQPTASAIAGFRQTFVDEALPLTT
jgi:hypothetical protein